MFYIHVSPDYSDNREDDVFGAAALLSGERIVIAAGGYGGQYLFDIRIEDETAAQQEFYGVDPGAALAMPNPFGAV